jgi:nitric oxide reductase activation protein
MHMNALCMNNHTALKKKKREHSIVGASKELFDIFSMRRFKTLYNVVTAFAYNIIISGTVLEFTIEYSRAF